MVNVNDSRAKRGAASARVGLALLIGLGAWVAPARAQYIPFQEDPIRYYVDNPEDPVAKLQERIDRGEKRLRFEAPNGYLRSVLAELDVPRSSQVLVYSRSSLQFRKVSPKTPRALYFNDDVYVGWINGGDFLEIVSFDANQGAIFYTVGQHREEAQGFAQGRSSTASSATWRRGLEACRGCSSDRSSRTARGTRPRRRRTYDTDHRSPLSERWGGWYVTGAQGRQPHLGNLIIDEPKPENLDATAGGNAVDLSSRFPLDAYAARHSDIVAHLVLDHQAPLHNLITRANYETRLGCMPRRPRAAAGRAVARGPQADRRSVGGAGSLSPLRRRGPAHRSGRRRFGIREGVLRSRSPRRSRSLAARLRSRPEDLQIPLQLPDLLQGVRRPSRAVEGLRLSKALRGAIGRRRRSDVRTPLAGGPASDPRDPRGHQTRPARKLEARDRREVGVRGRVSSRSRRAQFDAPTGTAKGAVAVCEAERPHVPQIRRGEPAIEGRERFTSAWHTVWMSDLSRGGDR